jgi:hypothetical protein
MRKLTITHYDSGIFSIEKQGDKEAPRIPIRTSTKGDGNYQIK